MSEPIPTQPIPPSLKRAVALLDTALLRDDVPLQVGLELADVYSALLDVRPPYPPALADSTVELIEPWPAVVEDVISTLSPLVAEPNPSASPSVVIGYGLAIRTLRATLTNNSGGPADRPPTSAES